MCLMKRLLILSACALCLAAVLSAQTPVNVTGPINTPEGLPWTGTLQISNPPVICGSIKVAKSTIHVTVTAGVFDRTLNLYPIADCGSGGYGYTVQSIGTDGNRPASYWVIHASAAPVTVAQIEQSTPPSPSATVPLSILQLSTGNDGDCLTKLGGGAITNPCAGGLGYYLVSQSANAPQNAIDLALLSSGLLKIIVSGGVASISTAAAGTDYQAPISGAPEAWPTFAAVATSGSYADLSNRPTIPSTTAQITESGNLYFTPARVVAAMAGLYQAPITGAPGSWPATWPWASLSGVPASFTPSAHASTHAAAGSDPLSLSASQIGSGYPYASLSGAPSIPSASSATPAMDGTGAAGSSANYARADHIHPTDTSRQAAIAPGTQAQYLRGDFSLATFPTTWPWGSLSSVPSTFTPSAHASTHAAAGSDPISVSASQVGNGYPYLESGQSAHHPLDRIPGGRHRRLGRQRHPLPNRSRDGPRRDDQRPYRAGKLAVGFALGRTYNVGLEQPDGHPIAREQPELAVRSDHPRDRHVRRFAELERKHAEHSHGIGRECHCWPVVEQRLYEPLDGDLHLAGERLHREDGIRRACAGGAG